MSDQPELPGIPEAPEVPEFIVWLRWLAHLIFGDPTMIKKTWRSILLLAFVLSAGVLFVDRTLYEQRISNLDAAEHTDKSTILQLQEELKGASPQLAALQARRIESREQLQKLFVQDGDLYRKAADIKGGTSETAKKEEEMLQEVHAWDQNTQDFIKRSFGEAALERYLDSQTSMIFFGSDQNISDILNALRARRLALEVLMETSAYDK